MDLRRLSMSVNWFKDEHDIQYLLQNAKKLEKLQLSVGRYWSLVRLHDVLSLCARTLKALDLSIFLYPAPPSPPLAGLCEELEVMAGHNRLGALSFEVKGNGYEIDERGGGSGQAWVVCPKTGFL